MKRKIGLYGATGFTGELVARELEACGVDYLIAGRSGDKLRQLAGRLDSHPEVVVAATDDAQALDRVAERSRVLVNCAGPFTFYGPPVVFAALARGAHYLDSAGEQPFMKLVYDRHHEAAAKRGVCILPGVGFEYAVSDLYLPASFADFDSVESLVVGYAVRNFGKSIGTRLSILEMADTEQWEYTNAEWKKTRNPYDQRLFSLGGERTVTMGRFPGGEILLAPLTRKDLREVRTYMAGLPPPAAATVARGVLRLPGVKGAAARLLRAGSAGPKPAAREKAHFTILHEVHGRVGDDLETQTHVIRGHDIYGLTAKGMAQMAIEMAADDFAGRGVTSPASVLDSAAWRDRYASWGVTFERLD